MLKFKWDGLTLFGVTILQPVYVVTGCESKGMAGVPYLSRLRIIEYGDKKNPRGFGLYLHYFHRSDEAGAYHTHPWNFTSLPIWNGYIEEVPTVYPDWQSEPERAARFHSTVQGTRRYMRPQAANADPVAAFFLWLLRYCPADRGTWGRFCGTYDPTLSYPQYAIVEDDGFYYERESKLPTPDFRPSESARWKMIDPHAPRCLDILPFTINRRHAHFTHRVRLHRTATGKEKPAITIVWRGPKVGSWGFWEGDIFTPFRVFFKREGCGDA